jgi:hypothetical protein
MARTTASSAFGILPWREDRDNNGRFGPTPAIGLARDRGQIPGTFPLAQHRFADEFAVARVNLMRHLRDGFYIPSASQVLWGDSNRFPSSFVCLFVALSGFALYYNQWISQSLKEAACPRSR